jgi:hypothetical protein
MHFRSDVVRRKLWLIRETLILMSSVKGLHKKMKATYRGVPVLARASSSKLLQGFA